MLGPDSVEGMDGPRSFHISTLGCQMNAHDSERIAGQLLAVGYREATSQSRADVIVINTCAVRENADNRLYGNLGQLRELKVARPEVLLAVGGCLAQKDKGVIVDRAPWVDVVFGTHNLASLPALLDRARATNQAQVEIAAALESFPSDLPSRRATAYSAWVSISVGCNNTCTYCIVPAVRGREQDRDPDSILGEVRALVDDGVVEVTLLGQNVNSYGVAFGDRSAFARLLAACADVPGLRRLRFTSPHPRDLTADVIDVMASTDTVMPHLHLPLQSGSDQVLARMRRSYRANRFLDLVASIREAVPGIAITTDVIVGFPGETADEFAETLRVVTESDFAGAFTFKYSPRPGTEAASMPDQVPADVVAERYERLVSLVDAAAWRQGQMMVGQPVELLAVESRGRKGGQTNRLSGRSRDNRLVHFRAGDVAVRPGDLVTTRITHAAPHHLLADEDPVAVEATSGGDAWESLATSSRSGGPATASSIVELAVPTVRVSAG